MNMTSNSSDRAN